MKIYNKLKFLLISKWEFKKIKKQKYLIIGHDNSYLIQKYIPKKKSEVISLKKINFYIILKLLISGKKFSEINYYLVSIKITDPQIILTMIDNNTNFYRLKNFFPSKKFISIQNGYRTEPKKAFLIKKNDKLSCDVIFCWGKQGIDYYKSLFNVKKIIPIGSLKNNLVSQKKIKKKNIITYISEYRDNDENKEINYLNLQNIYWRDYISSEKKLIKIASEFCKKNKIKFCIMGRTKNTKNEIEYFQSIINKDLFKYISTQKTLSSYYFLKRSEIIISMSSSLGYEFLSRENKMIFFSRQIQKKRSLLSKLFLFGWPFVKRKKGFFYSDDVSYKEFFRLVKNVRKCNKDIWIKEKKIYQKNLISYNYNNSLLKNELKIN